MYVRLRIFAKVKKLTTELYFSFPEIFSMKVIDEHGIFNQSFEIDSQNSHSEIK